MGNAEHLKPVRTYFIPVYPTTSPPYASQSIIALY